MAQLILSLLGSLRVVMDEQQVTSFGYDKVRALLAYVLLEGDRPLQRDFLAALLWPDAPAGIARKNLRTALASLRQAIGDTTAQLPVLLVNRDTIQRNPHADVALDVTELRTHLAAVERHGHFSGQVCADCAEQLASAAELYRGAFLQQISVPDSVAWEEWALVTRERLHGQMLDALAQLMAYHEAAGADEQARTYAWRALAQEAWDEAAHRCLMRVYARSGQRNAALAQYERCHKVLANELGVEPAAETTALYERIRNDRLVQTVDVQSANDSTAPSAGHASSAVLSDPEIAADDHTVAAANNNPPALHAASEPITELVPMVLPTIAQHLLPQHSAYPATSERNRDRMLDKVRRFWIAGVLEQSLHGAALIELGLAYRPDAVEYPWQMIIQQPDQRPRTLPPGTPIINVFDALDGELSILGAPGSGKTTMLLELTRALLTRAVQNPSVPIPVVFNLSSWAVQRRPLDTWLVDELNTRYQVPRRIGQAWVESEQVLPLLDGLDEMALTHRAACVAVINQFREQHWLLNMVVCSRSADYDVLTARLRLQGAVVVQPLTSAQVNAYLAQGVDKLVAVRILMQEDATLYELADTPLLLNIMVLAYQGMPIDTLRTHESLEERRQHLFDTYVQRMFARRSTHVHYTAQQTLRWLAWLARAMAERSQTMLFIEGLQPDWLPSGSQRRLFAGGVGLGVGMLVGTFAALANLESIVVRSGAQEARARLGAILLAAIGGAVCASALGMVSSTSDSGQISKRQRWWALTRNAIWLGAAFALTYGLTGWISTGLNQVAGAIPGFGLIGITIALISQPGQIAVVERHYWSWAKTRRRLLPIIGLTLVCGTSWGWQAGLLGSVEYVLAGIIILSLVLGMSTGVIESRTLPNQGIWWSARNAAYMSALFGLVAGVIVAGIFIQFVGVSDGLAMGFGSATIGALLGGLIYGGLACIQHFVLRVLLWRSGVMPWHYARFLDEAAERLFLRKVGGGYIFVHRLLLEYFAAMDSTAFARATAATMTQEVPLSEATLE